MGSDTCDGYGGWDHVVEDAAVVIPNGEEEARATLMARLGAASPRFVDGDVMGAGVGGREEAGERDVVIICRCQRTVVEVGLGGRATKTLRLHRQRATATAKEGDGNAEQRKKGWR
ncbi:hypothetical protein BHM03_00013722 [Ensete ventricosum]|nr:hypothetical protein BHM03_00013722 [Ensete ventricosum]